MSIEQREFRNAVGCFATGVTVVTTLDSNGAKVGITANSFSSLSLDPPLILFCIDSKINSFDAFENCANFIVNVLNEEQQDISNNFARSSDEKWEGIMHDFGENGCPSFANAVAILECRKHAIHEGGDHLIVVGEVTHIKYDSGNKRPLLYYKGSYSRIS